MSESQFRLKGSFDAFFACWITLCQERIINIKKEGEDKIFVKINISYSFAKFQIVECREANVETILTVQGKFSQELKFKKETF